MISIFSVLTVVPNTASAVYSSYSPIIINDDSGFTNSSGVIWGSGTVIDPYLISGWDIGAGSSRNAIFIGNTTAFFRVHDCHLHDGSMAGIQLLNVTNGNISDLICTSNNYGIYLLSTNESTLFNNTCQYNSDSGLLLISSNNISAIENNCRLNIYGIFIEGNSNRVIGNICSDDNGGYGIVLSGANHSVVSDNICENNLYHSGLLLSTSNDCTITNNYLSINAKLGDGHGLELVSSNRNFISNNTCYNNYNTGIYLISSSNNTIVNNTCSANSYGINVGSFNNNLFNNICNSNTYGICLDSTGNNCTISDNICQWNWEDGIYAAPGSNSNNITANTCSNNINGGVCLDHSNRNVLSNNSCSRDAHGISIGYSNNNTILRNNCSANGWSGIDLYNSSDDTLENNSCNDDYFGMCIVSSTGIKLRYNVMINDGIQILGENVAAWNSHDIDGSNTVGGKPVMYCVNLNGTTVSTGAGQLILANCTNLIVANQTISRASIGIQMGFSSNNNVTSNDCTVNGQAGISVICSLNNTIVGNNCSDNYGSGISLLPTGDSNSLISNICSNNQYGINVDSSFNVISGNDCSNNTKDGIILYSSNNTVANNKCAYNDDDGIYISSTIGDTVLSGNNCSNNVDGGIHLDSSSYNTVSNNTCSDNLYGIIIYYSFVNLLYDDKCHHNQIGIDFQYSSNLNKVNRCTCDFSTSFGIRIDNSAYNSVGNSTIMYNGLDGIYIRYSNYIAIHHNLIEANAGRGVAISDSSVYNLVWMNSFIDNNGAVEGTCCSDHPQAFDAVSANSWDQPGSPHGHGNYWNDWSYPDVDGDGIRDSPYWISGYPSTYDYYPLNGTAFHRMRLSSPDVLPAVGQVSATNFTYSVRYYDSENNAPTVKMISIDGTPHQMSTTDTKYDDGSIFTFKTTLPDCSNHTYYFEFACPGQSMRYPEIGAFDGPIVGIQANNSHAPIYITSNADFATTALIEGWLGEGSKQNPYVIKDLDINASSTTGINIIGTNAYFTIRNVTVHSNTVPYGESAIRLTAVSNATIENCTLFDNTHGMFLLFSGNVTLRNNSMFGCGIYILGTYVVNYSQYMWEWDTYDIDMSNLVNGRPIFHCKNQNGGSVPSGIGQAILVNCSNMIIDGQDLSHTDIGVEIEASSHIEISNNDCSLDSIAGILVLDSLDIRISKNICNWSDHGIEIDGSNNNFIDNNTVCHCLTGIVLYFSDQNTILGNLCSWNIGVGIDAAFSNRNHICFNELCSNGGMGMFSGTGMFFNDCDNDIVNHNSICNNSYYGIYFTSSLGNKVWNNSLIGNHGAIPNGEYDAIHLQALGWDTAWDVNGRGNYWSDHSLLYDNNNDGIGDRSYLVTEGSPNQYDHYPLMTIPITHLIDDRPTTAVIINATLGNNEWYVSDSVISFVANDDVARIKWTTYRIDGGPFQNQTDPVTNLSDGIHLIEFYSVNSLGYFESIKSITIKIDRSAPTTTTSISGTNVTIASIDATSGLNRTIYRIDGGAWVNYSDTINVSSPGNHSIEYYSIDNAGNQENIKSAWIENIAIGPGFDELILVVLCILIVTAAIIVAVAIIILPNRKTKKGR